MLRILVPIATMVAGVVVGIFIGARRRGMTPADADGSPPARGWGRRLLARVLALLGGAALRIRPVVARLGQLIKPLGQRMWRLRRSLRSLPLLSRRNEKGGHRLRKYLDRVSLPGKSPCDSVTLDDSRKLVDPAVLNCRARIGREPDGESWRSVLIVDICGTIQSPDDGHEVRLEVSLQDVTEDVAEPMLVLNRPKQGPIQSSSHFTHQTDMGKLCHQTTVLEDWTSAARISPEWFVLPRQGHRNLQFNIAIVSRTTGQRLAASACTAAYENIEIGYLDIEDRIQRAKTLAVALAFSVGAANHELLDTEIDVIHGWVRTNFGSGEASDGARLELERALQKTAAFFRRGGQLNIQDICAEVMEIAPMVGRLDILDLCLRVAGAKGQVTAPELTLLKDLAGWLQVDRSRLRTMVEKRLPVSMHQTQDEEMILGLTAEMNRDEARHQLNREYAKWSSRVISSDPAIRNQADQMLNLIANARTQYVGVKLAK